MKKSIVLLALIPLIVTVFSGAANALVTGSAEWHWADYQRDVDGGEQTDLSHFYQQYSLFYRDRQLITNGRAGRWTVGLGYEWTALDLSGSLDESVETSKVLYEGELQFNPVALPLQFKAYSYDLMRAYPSLIPESAGTIIAPHIFTGINNGQHINSGVTMVLGESMGSLVVGDYREFLATMPRLLLDFREEYVRNLKAAEPEHYRIRDLAFVSLNRKNNWFHYKIYDYSDFLDETNNGQEKMWLLGTIDHLNRRKWINLTNWMKISADGSLTQTEGSLQNVPGGREDLYQLNLFSSASRRSWHADNFTSLSRRTTKRGSFEKSFDFPFFAQIQTDPLHLWRMTLLASRWEEGSMEGPATTFDQREDSFYAKLQLESKAYTGKLYAPKVELDWRRTDKLEGRAARIGFELSSDNPLERGKDWLLSYSLARFESSQLDGSEDGVYHEQTVMVAANRSSATMRYGGSQELAVGSGDYDIDTTNHLTPVISQKLAGEYELNERSLHGTSYRSTTDAYIELISPRHWRNRFRFSYDLFRSGETLHQLQLGHRLDYNRGQVSVQADTLLAEGDQLSYPWSANELIDLQTITGTPNKMFSHSVSAAYLPSRYWDTRGRLSALWGEGDKGDGWLLLAEQEASFHLFEASGIPRKWLSLQEHFDYQQVWGDASLWYAELEFTATYYATRYLTFEALCAVRHYGLTEQLEYEFEASALAKFSKFEARLAYAYGQLNEEAFLPGVKEQRWELGLKKTF